MVRNENNFVKFTSKAVAFILLSAGLSVLPVINSSAASANEPPANPPTATQERFGISQEAINGETAPADCPTTAPAGTVPQGEDVRQLCLDAVRHATTFEAERAIKYAFSKLGTGYSQDSKLRETTMFDCSSFIGRAFSAANAPLRRWNGMVADYYGQFSWTGAYVPVAYFPGGYRYGYEGTNLARVGGAAELKPGDIIIQFTSDATDPGSSSGNAGHAQLYIGGGMVIQAGGGARLVNVDQHVNYLGQEWYFRYNTLDAAKTGPLPPMQAGETQKVNVGVPHATVYGNLTVTDALAQGHTTVYPCEEPRPLASNSNYYPNRNVGTFVVTHSDSQGNICLYVSQRANIIWDQTFTTWLFLSHAPVRTVDTRSNSSGVLKAGEVRKVHAAASELTVAGVLTTTNSAGVGYVTVYPCNTSRPTASNVNYTTGYTVANSVFVKTDADGDFCVYSPVQTDFIWDQVMETHAVPAASPSRKTDTRNNIPAGAVRLGAGQTRILSRTALANGAAYGNLTVTQPGSPGWVVVWPCDQPRPLASTVNFVAGQTVANYAVARTDRNGDICAYTTAATHIIWDETVVMPGQHIGIPVRLLDTRRIL